MLSYNEVTQKKYIVMDGEPYEVLTSHVFRKQQRKPVNATKLRNLVSGKVMEHSFHVSDKAEEAELETRTVKYLYNNKGEVWFCEEKDPSKRFSLKEDVVGEKLNFMKVNMLVDLLTFGDKLLGIKLPIKMELRVKEAAPAVRGNTAQGGLKQVTLETGVVLNVPMFINEGDTLIINTETGEYVSRV